jgi:hypothetical protein
VGEKERRGEGEVDERNSSHTTAPLSLSLHQCCRQRANESSHLLRYQFSDVMPSLRYTTCVPHETSLHVRGVMAVTLVPFGATSECPRQTLTVDKG